ncbi:MAG TPA: toll/interleukin-1 receptor domain-containing protein [Anaeromyxobacter sp.]|nr:toll/interleukin-1 receptor domain-containing protein [Anaeromyxobacter sp.]
MAYLAPQFRNDVFVSYRHAANEGPDHWVDEFCSVLRASLRDLLGPVGIWVDNPPLPAGEQWRRTIRQELDAAAIFLAIFSMTYLDSDECRDELDNFLKWLKGSEGPPRRIVPVFKHPVDLTAVPHEVAGIQNYKFFEREPSPSARFVEYRPDTGEAAKGKFVQAVARLAQDLMFELRALRGLTPERSAGSVFLARVKPELHDERERIRAELRQRGYSVVPEREYLWHTDGFLEQLAADLSAADLCVHLISGGDSVEPEANQRTRLQLEKAVEAMKKASRPLPLVWIQPSAGKGDAESSALVDHVQRNLANEGVEYCQGSLEDFKTQIYDKLTSTRTAEAAVAEEVAVLTEEGDIGATAPISGFLVDALKLEPRRISFSGAKPKDPTALAAALERCGHAIVYWGSATEEWVRQILDLKPVVGRAGAERLCVYAAAPATPEKTTFRSGRAQLLVETAGLNEGALRQFLVGRGPTR